METAMSWRISNSKPCAPLLTRLPVSVLLVLNIGEGVLVDVDIPQATTLLDCRDFSGAISQHATMKLWILQDSLPFAKKLGFQGSYCSYGSLSSHSCRGRGTLRVFFRS